jgi:SHAQKYF class myb-like DNA-binding protein
MEKPVATRVGRWSPDEHTIFLEGMRLYPQQWDKIAKLVKTRTVVQIRSHSQKCWLEPSTAASDGTTKTSSTAASKSKRSAEQPGGGGDEKKPKAAVPGDGRRGLHDCLGTAQCRAAIALFVGQCRTPADVQAALGRCHSRSGPKGMEKWRAWAERVRGNIEASSTPADQSPAMPHRTNPVFLEQFAAAIRDLLVNAVANRPCTWFDTAIGLQRGAAELAVAGALRAKATLNERQRLVTNYTKASHEDQVAAHDGLTAAVLYADMLTAAGRLKAVAKYTKASDEDQVAAHDGLTAAVSFADKYTAGNRLKAVAKYTKASDEDRTAAHDGLGEAVSFADQVTAGRWLVAVA